MLVCQKGTRLSITPVGKKHFTRVLKLAGVNPWQFLARFQKNP